MSSETTAAPQAPTKLPPMESFSESEYFKLALKNIDESKFEEARANFAKVAAEFPSCPEIWYNLGVVNFKNLKNLNEAVMCFERALKLRPSFPACASTFSSALVDIAAKLASSKTPKDHEQAMAIFERATFLDRKNHIAWYNLGVIIGALVPGIQGLLRSIQCHEIAIDINSSFAPAFFMLGVEYNTIGRIEEALGCFDRVLSLDPKHKDARVCFATSFYETGNYHRTLKILGPEVDDKENPVVQNMLGMIERERGNPVLAQQIMRESRNRSKAIWSNYLFLQNYNPELDIKEHEDSCREYDDAAQTAVKELVAALQTKEHCEKMICEWKSDALFCASSPATSSDSLHNDPVIRIGFVSGDIREHSVSYFIEPFIRNFSKASFEVFIYSIDFHGDDRTELFKRMVGGDSHFRLFPSRTETTEAICRAVMADKIHILVDLAGQTGNNALYTFAAKPAPVQVSYIGYPNTTALTTIDWRIVDDIVWPQNSKQYSSERLKRLPGCFTCYMPPAHLTRAVPYPQQRPLASRMKKDGRIYIGSFTGVAKINDYMLRVWARIMQTLGSKKATLVLKSRLFISKTEQLSFMKKMAAAGIDVSNVLLFEQTPTTLSHLKAYELLDLTMDTFPYSGTTTTCESMWQGVPVVTMRGVDRQSHNVSASLLHAIDLDCNIANNEDEYVARVVDLVNNPEKIREMSGESLRKRMRHSILCDVDTHVRNLSAAFKEMMKEKCDQ